MQYILARSYLHVKEVLPYMTHRAMYLGELDDIAHILLQPGQVICLPGWKDNPHYTPAFMEALSVTLNKAGMRIMAHIIPLDKLPKGIPSEGVRRAFATPDGKYITLMENGERVVYEQQEKRWKVKPPDSSAGR